MMLRVLIPGLFFLLALIAGVSMYAFSNLNADAPNPLLATTGNAPRPVPVAGASVTPLAPDVPDAGPTTNGTSLGRSESRQITLYVSRKNDLTKLVAHPITLDSLPGMRDIVDRVITALAGPFDDPELVPTVPKGTKLLSVFVMRKQMLVNLSREVEMGHSGGTLASRLTVYSLVNTLVDLGLAEEVKILVQGREEPAFMDHLDLTRSLAFDSSVLQSKQAPEPAPSPAAKALAGTAAAVGNATGRGK